MKKNFLKLLFISFFLFIVFPNCASAYAGYTIENYDVEVTVNEDSVFNIKETLDVNFEVPSHGITRGIPVRSNRDKKKPDTYVNPKIRNIRVSEQYTKSTEDGIMTLKIGNPNVEITGDKTYVIEYDYDAGKDINTQVDFVYFNLIGTDISTDIMNVTFKITMPKDFDQTKINFPIGTYGATYNEAVNYEINDNVITGYVKQDEVYHHALGSYEGLTVKIELPDGYFVGARESFDPTLILLGLLAVLAIAALIIGFILFMSFGFRKKDLLVPEYIVPYDMTPSEIGYLYDGYTKNEHIVSLIIYCANKGYMKIIDEEKNNFSFQKLKEIDESEPDYVVKTFNGIFKSANKDGIVKKSQLTDKFYTTLELSKKLLSKKHKIYSPTHTLTIAYDILAIIAFFFLTPFLVEFMTYKVFDEYILLFIGLVFLLIILGISLVVFMIFTKKRTPEATKLYEKTRGFKDYLMTVEKEKLEMMVEENPNYFFDILPYAYVLGVSSVWSKKFESIVMKAPDWYTGTMYNTATGMFDVNRFNNSLTKTLNTTKTTMSSRPYESSGTSGGGSFSSGGGFSGGGGGGGSVGRW